MAASSFPPLAEREYKNTICLFDVDGTLTPARLVSGFFFLKKKKMNRKRKNKKGN